MPAKSFVVWPQGGPNAPVITTLPPIPGAVIGTPYSLQLNAIGGTPPYTWILVSDSGGQFNVGSASGILGGTPTGSNPSESITIVIRDKFNVPSVPVTYVIGIPPLVPQNLGANGISTTLINLTWTSVTDSNLQDYGVYRNGVLIGFTTNNLSFTDTGLTPGTTYTYNVTSRNTFLVQSGQSAPASASTQSGGATISNNQPLTINGTGFGVKSGQVAPQLADSGIDAPIGSTSPQWTQSQNAPNQLTGIYNMQNQPVGFSPSGALIGAPHPFVTTLQAGCHRFLAGSQPSDPGGGETGNDVGTAKAMVSPTTTFCWRQAFWMKIDPNVFCDPQSDQNTKLANYNMGSVFYPASGNAIYTNMQANASVLTNVLRQFNAGHPTVISAALPLAANPYVVGQRVCFTGMPSTHLGLNNVTGNITAIGGVNNNWTATLDCDTTGFTSFATSARSVVSIDATNPAVVHFTDAGPTNPCAIGSMVNFFNVTGMTGINNPNASVQMFVTAIGGASPNYTATVNFNGGATPGSGGLMYIGVAPTPRYPDINPNPLLVTDGPAQPPGDPMWDLPDNLGHNSTFMSRVFHPANISVGWCRVVMEGCMDSTPGGPGYFKEVWYSQGLNQVKNGTYGTQYAGRTSNTAGMAVGHFTLQQGNYMRDRSPTNFRYYCDGFMDITGPGVTGQCAVVYVTDNPVFASSLVKQEQSAATWTNTQITIPHFKQGALQSNTTGYIHICRETDPVGTALANGSFTIGVTSVPTITNASLPNAGVGSSYSTTITVTGGTAPYTYYLPTALPNTGGWLTINSSTGVLSGTPSTLETENVFLGVKDANGYTAFANLSLNVVAVAFDFFISSSGSDANPGTLAQPWALTALNTKRTTYKGKKVGIIGGTYSCLTIVGGTYSGTFDTPAFNIAGGTSGAPTFIASCNSSGIYSARAAILDGGMSLGNSSANPGGQPLIGSIGAQSAWLTIDGLEIKNSYNRAISLGFQTGVAQPTTYTQGIIVQNCSIHDAVNNASQNAGANAALVTIYSSDGAIVQNNKIFNASSTDGRASGVEIWTSKNCVSQFNTVTNIGCNSNGSGIGHKNSFQFSNTVAFNYIDLSMNGALYQGCVCVDEDGVATTTNTINNNVLIGNCWIGASIANSSGVPKRKYFNNTCVSPSGQSVGGIITQPINAGQMTFFNNILARTGATGARGDMNANTSSFALLDYNLYPIALRLGATPNGTNNDPSTLATSISAWVAQLTSPPAGTESHSITGTPVFVGGTPTLPSQAYQLQAGSPGKGTGSTTGTTGGTATDMGAWGNGATQVGSSF